MSTIYCSKCGKKLDKVDMKNGFFIEGTMGYGSEFDGCEIDMHLCCDCVDKLIKSCSVSPIKEKDEPEPDTYLDMLTRVSDALNKEIEELTGEKKDKDESGKKCSCGEKKCSCGKEKERKEHRSTEDVWSEFKELLDLLYLM